MSLQVTLHEQHLVQSWPRNGNVCFEIETSVLMRFELLFGHISTLGAQAKNVCISILNLSILEYTLRLLCAIWGKAQHGRGSGPYLLTMAQFVLCLFL